jgi:hypothetical protein
LQDRHKSIAAQRARKTKSPPNLRCGGVLATVWLPVAQAQYLLTLQPVLRVGRARLLTLPVSANLTFPQGPSALSDCLIHQSLTVDAINLPPDRDIEKSPKRSRLCHHVDLRYTINATRFDITIDPKRRASLSDKALNRSIARCIANGFVIDIQNVFSASVIAIGLAAPTDFRDVSNL